MWIQILDINRQYWHRCTSKQFLMYIEGQYWHMMHNQAIRSISQLFTLIHILCISNHLRTMEFDNSQPQWSHSSTRFSTVFYWNSSRLIQRIAISHKIENCIKMLFLEIMKPEYTIEVVCVCPAKCTAELQLFFIVVCSETWWATLDSAL